MVNLEYSPILDRLIRLDDLETLAISTQTLAEEAITRGEEAVLDSILDALDYGEDPVAEYPGGPIIVDFS